MEGVGGGIGRDRLDTSSADGGSGRDDGGKWPCGSVGRSSMFTYMEDSGVFAEESLCWEVDACYWIMRTDDHLAGMGMVIEGNMLT